MKSPVTLMYEFLFCFVCDSLHMAEFYVSLWLVLQLSNWEHIVSAVTGSWAALFAKGKAGYIQSSFRSPRFCSSPGNVKWLLRKVQCLFTSAPSATEVFAHSWSEAFTLGQRVAGYLLCDILPSCMYSQDMLAALVSGWVWDLSERIALQGVFTWLCVVFCWVCRWLHEALNNCRSGKGKNILENEQKML